MAPPLLALFGPTGVGKTDVAIALAERIRARGGRPVAVAADALQVYAGLEILTGVADARAAGAPRAPARRRSCRSTRASRSPSTPRSPTPRSTGCSPTGATPIVVGGTGLYLRAALAELELRPPPPPGVRERWQAAMDERGPEALHAELARAAPASAQRIGPRDRHRIIRSLELLEQGALAEPGGANHLWTSETRHPTRLVGLVRDRDELYARIDRRVDAMVARGAIEQVRRADAAGASQTARVALGFEELLEGDVDAMKRRTRRYARRQLTWMRKLPDVELVDVTRREPEAVAAVIDSAPV